MRVNLKRFKDLKLLVSLHFAFPRFQAKFSRIVKGPARGSQVHVVWFQMMNLYLENFNSYSRNIYMCTRAQSFEKQSLSPVIHATMRKPAQSGQYKLYIHVFRKGIEPYTLQHCEKDLTVFERSVCTQSFAVGFTKSKFSFLKFTCQ